MTVFIGIGDGLTPVIFSPAMNGVGGFHPTAKTVPEVHLDKGHFGWRGSIGVRPPPTGDQTVARPGTTVLTTTVYRDKWPLGWNALAIIVRDLGVGGTSTPALDDKFATLCAPFVFDVKFHKTL